MKYDLVVVGAGPAGIFTALEMTRRCPGASVLILEQGPGLGQRSCPLNMRLSSCRHCSPCRVVTGWGGAGAFSDGKLTLTTDFGGQLGQYIGTENLADLIEYVDKTYVEFGGTEQVWGGDTGATRDLARRAAAADLILIPARIRHLGTENCPVILGNMEREIRSRGVEIRTGVAVKNVRVSSGRATGVTTTQGEEISARYVVAAPGRVGSGWLARQAEDLGLEMEHNPVDVGVRVEVPSVITEPLTDVLYESKILYYTKSFDDQVRIFCMCPYGMVTVEENDGLVTVNGHSFRSSRTDNTNFALLVSKTFTQPFKEPIAYGRNIAALANMLGGGVLVQRLGDLLNGRRSTAHRMERGLVRPTLQDATPGDLSLVLPYRHLKSILEMIEALDHLVPGVKSRHTLLYGVEVKFYSSRPQLEPTLETRVRNLFAAGDGAGVTRGLIQASAAGVHVARVISDRIKGE